MENYELKEEKFRQVLDFMNECGAKLDGEDIQRLYNIVENNIEYMNEAKNSNSSSNNNTGIMGSAGRAMGAAMGNSIGKMTRTADNINNIYQNQNGAQYSHPTQQQQNQYNNYTNNRTNSTDDEWAKNYYGINPDNKSADRVRGDVAQYLQQNNVQQQNQQSQSNNSNNNYQNNSNNNPGQYLQQNGVQQQQQNQQYKYNINDVIGTGATLQTKKITK